MLPALTAGLLLLGSTASVHAGDCGNVTSDGLCVDGKTLVWCDDGQVKEFTCPGGEVCVSHEAFGDGFGCIATQYTACGDVPEEGRCSTDGQRLTWCDTDRVRDRRCNLGSVCAWVEDEQWYDCVQATQAAQRPEPTEPTDDGTEPVVEPTPPNQDLDQEAGGPVPNVEKGGAAAEPIAGGGAGCQAAGGLLDPLVILAGLLLGGLIISSRPQLKPIRIKRPKRDQDSEEA
jgi:hypothetical protein